MSDQFIGVDVGGTKIAVAVLEGGTLSEARIVTTNQARRTLDYLYEKLQKGGSVERSDVEGAIRMAPR